MKNKIHNIAYGSVLIGCGFNGAVLCLILHFSTFTGKYGLVIMNNFPILDIYYIEESTKAIEELS